MTETDFIYAFPPGLRRLAANTDLAENDLRMFQGDGIVVDYKDTHLMRDQTGFINLLLPVRLTQRNGNRKCGPFPLFTDNVDVSVHELYDAFRNGHAQAG